MSQKHEAWQIDVALANQAAFRHFKKRHEREYISCFNNLNKIKRLLEEGKKLSELHYHPSFFRHETDGIFRIGQSGVSGAKESRLYIYPDNQHRIIYILEIGTKETQQADIAAAQKAIQQIFLR
uniref:Addiction module toxin RelE n=1 Tax=Chlorobium chlorochromatii (strain CaD3) TaxID=340177 RepID=Q3AR55_CHLCH